MTLTDEEREELGGCAECMAALCEVCGHEPCPACVDDCDHPDCIEWNEETGSGTKKHECIFARCRKHAAPAGLINALEEKLGGPVEFVETSWDRKGRS